MTGITTITEDSNYGNRLQNYAVQSFLEKLGVEAGTIVYKTPFIRKLKNFVKICFYTQEARRGILPF